MPLSGRTLAVLCCLTFAILAACGGTTTGGLTARAPIDLTDPRAAASAFLEAILAGEPQRAQALCSGDGMRDEIEGLSAAVASSRRIEAALVARFGADAASALGAEADVRRVRAELAAAPVRVDGTTATIPLHGFFGAEALVLRRAAGEWRVAADRPADPTVAAYHRAAAGCLAAAADTVLKGVASGRYPTAKAAADDFSARCPAEPAELLGRWEMVAEPGTILELLPGGTGTIRGAPLTWSADRERLTVTDQSGTDTNAWRVAGDRLVLDGPFGTEIAFARAAGHRAAGSQGRGQVEEAMRVYALIEALVRLPSHGPKEIEEATGARLVVDGEHPTWVGYAGRSVTGPFGEVELRVDRDGPSGIVILRRPVARLAMSELDFKRYGPQRSVQVGPPEAGNWSITYDYSGFRLAFSFMVAGDWLQSVVLERASPK